MISSLVIVVVLCGVAGAEEKLVRIVTDRRKDEPRVEYQEEPQSGYPLIVQQPYPIIVEKRIPYNEERYDRKFNPSVYTSNREEFGYRSEILRPPIIFTVSGQPSLRSIPYPLRAPKETVPLPCTGDLNCLNEEFDYPNINPIKKKNTFKFGEGVKEENIKVSERADSMSSDYEKKEGSVQHKETFQTPILIAIEKPGYKYVKHLVGVGVLPKARQFHVLILEEDTSADIQNHEGLNNTENEPKNVLKDSPTKELLNDNKQEEKEEENKEKREIRLEGNDSGDSEIIFPTNKEESKADYNESPCDDKTEKEIEQDKIDDRAVTDATLDIKKK